MSFLLSRSKREKTEPSVTHSPVSADPLDPTVPVNWVFPTRSARRLYPGAFQVKVVLPDVTPAGSVIGLGFAESSADRA